MNFNSTIDRLEYLTRAREFCARGECLPQSVLTESDVVEIRRMHEHRQVMLEQIRKQYSNQAIADKFGVHVRTIEKIVQYQTWVHVLTK